MFDVDVVRKGRLCALLARRQINGDASFMDSVFADLLGPPSPTELRAELRLAGEQFQTVRVNRPWKACTASPPVGEEACDEGAVAVSPYGEDWSSSVLACPPPACVAGFELCPEHRFSAKVSRVVDT
jgi:hypothetical protein